MSGEDDLVVLLDSSDLAAGTYPRATVHSADTPRHLAFSCHLIDARGRVLMTRRALSKIAWPGVWTNACCGHPRPGERLTDAVTRRTGFELGVQVDELRLVLPEFGYRATDASGIVENEFCPVFVGRLDREPSPNPSEVMEYAWVGAEDLRTSLTATPWAFSPWLVAQAEHGELWSGLGATR